MKEKNFITSERPPPRSVAYAQRKAVVRWLALGTVLGVVSGVGWIARAKPSVVADITHTKLTTPSAEPESITKAQIYEEPRLAVDHRPRESAKNQWFLQDTLGMRFTHLVLSERLLLFIGTTNRSFR